MAASRPELARRAWRLMFDFLVRTSPRRTTSLARRGLTPNDARALSSLDPERPRTMGGLAEEWQCDASNATWVVDRLERAGLAARRPVAADRRVKHVVLTPKGAATKRELMEEFYTPPAELLALDRAGLEALCRVLERIPRPEEAAGT